MRLSIGFGLSIIFACGFLALGADLSREDAVKKDMALLQGEWSLVEGERDGQSLPERLVKSGRRVAKGDSTVVTIGGTNYMTATFTIDPTQSPKTIDYLLTEGRNKGKTQLGIYEIDGDTLKYCVAAVGLDRPTAFETKEGSGWSLVVWKREKK
jgi:uncharacterized protein (TIGR03067 family)